MDAFLLQRVYSSGTARLSLLGTGGVDGSNRSQVGDYEGRRGFVA